MDIERGPDAEDRAPKPDEETGQPKDERGTAVGSPRREDGARAIEPKDLTSANDEGAG